MNLSGTGELSILVEETLSLGNNSFIAGVDEERGACYYTTFPPFISNSTFKITKTDLNGQNKETFTFPANSFYIVNRSTAKLSEDKNKLVFVARVNDSVTGETNPGGFSYKTVKLEINHNDFSNPLSVTYTYTNATAGGFIKVLKENNGISEILLVGGGGIYSKYDETSLINSVTVGVLGGELLLKDKFYYYINDSGVARFQIYDIENEVIINSSTNSQPLVNYQLLEITENFYKALRYDAVNYTLELIIHDKDFNNVISLGIIDLVVPNYYLGTYLPKLGASGTIYSLAWSGGGFRQYLITQQTKDLPLLSGNTVINQVSLLDVFGDIQKESFKPMFLHPPTNKLVDLSVNVYAGSFSDKGYIQIADDDTLDNIVRWDVPPTEMGSTYYTQYFGIEQYWFGYDETYTYAISDCRVSNATLGTAYGNDENDCLVLFTIDMRNGSVSYEVLVDIRSLGMSIGLVVNRIMDYDVESKVISWLQWTQGPNSNRFYKMDCSGVSPVILVNNLIDKSQTSIPTMSSFFYVYQGYVSEEEIILLTAFNPGTGTRAYFWKYNSLTNTLSNEISEPYYVDSNGLRNKRNILVFFKDDMINYFYQIEGPATTMLERFSFNSGGLVSRTEEKTQPILLTNASGSQAFHWIDSKKLIYTKSKPGANAGAVDLRYFAKWNVVQSTKNQPLLSGDVGLIRTAYTDLGAGYSGRRMFVDELSNVFYLYYNEPSVGLNNTPHLGVGVQSCFLEKFNLYTKERLNRWELTDMRVATSGSTFHVPYFNLEQNEMYVVASAQDAYTGETSPTATLSNYPLGATSRFFKVSLLDGSYIDLGRVLVSRAADERTVCILGFNNVKNECYFSLSINNTSQNLYKNSITNSTTEEYEFSLTNSQPPNLINYNERTDVSHFKIIRNSNNIIASFDFSSMSLIKTSTIVSKWGGASITTSYKPYYENFNKDAFTIVIKQGGTIELVTMNEDFEIIDSIESSSFYYNYGDFCIGSFSKKVYSIFFIVYAFVEDTLKQINKK